MPLGLDKSINLTTMLKINKDISIAGRSIMVTLRGPAGNHTRTRAMKKNVTREQVRKNNDRLALRNLTLLLNSNFEDDEGAHFTLTYRMVPSPAEAYKMQENFLRRMKRAVPGLKYVAVTEYMNARIHHHIVMNITDVKLVEKVWGAGRVRATVLDSCGDYTDLAEYLIKETNKTFRDPDGPRQHRWSASRNLEKPATKRVEVSLSEIMDDPQPIAGYYIPEDRIRRFEHPVTGIETVEYLMIAIDKPRRYKTWPRGRRVSGREYYGVDIENEQENLFARFGI